MINLRNHTISLYIALLLFAITPVMGAELKPWNAPDALQLSDDLYSAARRLNIECRTSPPNYLDQEGDSGHTVFRYHVRHFMDVVRDLYRALEDGKSQAETQPIYDTSVAIIDDLKVYAVDNPKGAWPMVTNAVLKAEGILAHLGAYYAQP